MQPQVGELQTAEPDEGQRLERVTMLLVLAVACLMCVAMARSPGTYQWDFATFYYATKAWLHGSDPYLLSSLTREAGREITLPFLYPQTSLLYFIPLTLFSYATAWYLWLGLKLAALVALTRIWRRHVLPDVPAPLLVVLMMLGLGSAVWWDLVSGNVATFEQLLLWIGIAGFLHHRRTLFVTGIVMAATLKWTPLLFLGLALLPSHWRRGGWKTLAAGLGVFFMVGLLPHLLNSPLTASMFATLRQVREVGTTNPCALALVDHLGLLCPRFFSAYPLLRPALLLVYYAVIIGFSVPALRRLMRSDNRLALVLVSVAVYVVLLPRCKAYSYIVLIPTAAMLLQTVFTRWHGRIIALAVLCLPLATLAGQALERHTQANPLWVLASYYVWFLALGIWWVCVRGEPLAKRPPLSEEGGGEVRA